jgi:hypothetical protein
VSTAELPAVAITNPSDYFSTILDTGANILINAQSTISNGLWWIKDRANTNQHQLVDSVRGTGAVSNIPAQTVAAYATPAGNSVAWCWNAGGSPVTNNDGSVATQVSANTAAGFSVVTYSMATTTAGATFGHGLDQEPELIFHHNTPGPAGEKIDLAYHKDLGTNKYVSFSSSSPSTTLTNIWTVSPTTFGSGIGSNIVIAATQHIAYCWHSVPGYSSIGSYVGNGNADGPFVYTGFRPAFVMYKRTDVANDWVIKDSARNVYNPTKLDLYPSTTQAEISHSDIDFTSNGFKLRNALASSNASGGTYIYMAFAEHPFGGSNVSPAPAR